MSLDLDNLKAFHAVAQLNSFSLAAERLFLTQPAISKRVAALESQVKKSLFDRYGKSVTLTPAGRMLWPRAEAILQAADEAKRALDDMAGEVQGELRAATSHHIGLHKLPSYLRHFATHYPKVNLKLEFLDSEIALNKVLKGQCELAVVTLPNEPIDSLVLEPLWEDTLRFVTYPSSPLPEATNLITLSEHPAILPDLNTYTGRIIKACFDQRGLPLRIQMTTNYLETIKMLVSVGLGWSLLPESLLDDHLRPLHLGGVKLQRRLGIAHHKHRQLSNAGLAFYQLLQPLKSL